MRLKINARCNHKPVLQLCALLLVLFGIQNAYAQLSASIDLQTVYSSNVMGTVQPAPDFILEPLINVRYDHELHPQKSLYASFDFQPYYYTVVPDRSYNYAALEVGYELVFLRNAKANASAAKVTSKKTSSSDSALSKTEEKLTDSTAHKNINQKLVTADSAHTAASEDLSSIDTTSSEDEEEEEETDSTVAKESIKTTVLAADSVDNTTSKVTSSADTTANEEEVAEEDDSGEEEEVLANNTTLVEGDNIAVNGLSYESVGLREDNLLSEQVDYARKFTLVAHDEIQKNRKAYSYYSYNWLTVQPTYSYSPDSAHRYAGNYLFNSVYYPNDTLYTYLEHRIWGEGIVELTPAFVSHTTFGIGYRKYVHPVQVDTTGSQGQLQKSDVVSQSKFYQIDLGTGILWVLSDKNSEALYLKTTYSPGLTQASFIYTLNQGIRFAGNLIDNEFGYDKVGALGISKIRLPYDIDLGSTLDVEYKWYPYFKLTFNDNITGRSNVLDLKRNDTYYDISINASKTYEDDTKGFLTVFHSLTPSVSLEYYNNSSTLKYFKYHEFLITANISCGI